MKLILFEIKKLITSTYFLFMLVILALFICSYYIYNYMQTVRVDDIVADAEIFITNTKRGLDEIDAAIEAGEIKKDSPKVQSDIAHYQNIMEENETKKAAALAHDWDTLLDFEIAGGEQWFKTGLTNNYIWPTDFTMSVYFERNKFIKEHGLQPVFPIYLFSQVTIYDEVFEPPEIEKDKERDKIHSSSAVYFLYLLFSLGFGIIGAGFFLFLFGDILTKEGIGRNGSLYLLYTQPTRRGNVFISKYISLSLITLCILISVAGFSLLLGTTFDRFGELQYPVLIYEPEMAFHFMPMWQFIVLAASLFYLVLLFCYACLFFFSYLTKRTAIAIGLTVAFLFIGVQLSGQFVQTNFAAFNPFTYFHVADIVSMEVAVLQNNFELSIYNGYWVLGLASVVVLLVTYFMSRRHAQ
ncbi:ABC transporter permease [Virgibacillus soli]|uniref:ABC transporter permease subunit n=1 Tax=Paracerasibacillus soli TaxID=480284 RepID=A0ABU5CPZ8_9BACI|nr:ABC transporter permease subunit [Virgibacillus soli]MDY0407892.1 ABC transporter permease subunit [Virgibacillus soli]